MTALLIAASPVVDMDRAYPPRSADTRPRPRDQWRGVFPSFACSGGALRTARVV